MINYCFGWDPIQNLIPIWNIDFFKSIKKEEKSALDSKSGVQSFISKIMLSHVSSLRVTTVESEKTITNQNTRLSTYLKHRRCCIVWFYWSLFFFDVTIVTRSEKAGERIIFDLSKIGITSPLLSGSRLSHVWPAFYQWEHWISHIWPIRASKISSTTNAKVKP